jgi:hypothetical protein
MTTSTTTFSGRRIGALHKRQHFSNNTGQIHLIPFTVQYRYNNSYYPAVLGAGICINLRVAEPWNELLRETTESRNVQQFKRMLKNEWK